MMKSRHGRAVLAIRDNEIAAESCGIQTTYYKVMAFAFSAAFAGLAGGLYACYIGVLNPSTFGFMKSIEILVMVVLGGMGSMLGSILSATVLTILPEATRSFDSYRMVIYSLVHPDDDLPSGRTAGQLRFLHEPHRGKGHERRAVPQEEC